MPKARPSKVLATVLTTWLLATGLLAQSPQEPRRVADADLPTSNFAVDWESPASLLVIDLERDGAALLDGRLVEFDELVDGMRRRAREVSDVPVLLRVHKAVPAVVVQRVLDACVMSRVGLWKVQFAVRGGQVVPNYLSKAAPKRRPMLLRVWHDGARPVVEIGAALADHEKAGEGAAVRVVVDDDVRSGEPRARSMPCLPRG